MTDRELLRTLMFVNEWTQADLAQKLGFHQSNVSRVIHGKQDLPQERRERAKRLLMETKEKRRK